MSEVRKTEKVTLTDAEHEALVEAIGNHCHHTGTPDYSLPNWCRDCEDMVRIDVDGTVERIIGARVAAVLHEAADAIRDREGNALMRTLLRLKCNETALMTAEWCEALLRERAQGFRPVSEADQ